MVDINLIRQDPEAFKKASQLKQLNVNIEQLLTVDQKRRDLMTQVEDLRKQRNEAAEKRDIEKGKSIKQQLEDLEEKLKSVELEFNKLMVQVPTIPAPDTPICEDESGNVEIYKSGELPKFDFTPKDHVQLGKDLDILDLGKGAKVGGYRGYFLKNEGVLLVLALVNFALRKVIAKGYTPMIPPTLVKEFALFGSGYFKGLEYNNETDEIYQVGSSDKESGGETSKDKKFLVGTAEPSLLAYFADEILDGTDLPIRVCGYSQCYRSEIGSYGKDTKGHYRVHEFMKVEQVVISKADLEESDKLQQEMLDISKEILEDLGLPFRVIRICSGDLSAGKYKQFDYEIWMPGLQRWGEAGSASNFLDWQARRLKVRYKDKDGSIKYAYLLNATALPTPRPFIGILENFQQEDGTVRVPDVLIPYTGFSEIKPKS